MRRGQQGKFDAIDLDAQHADGNPMIAQIAHLALAAAANNDGTQTLHRAFSYSDGLNVVAERWRPRRQCLKYGGSLFAIPPGRQEGGVIGQALF